MLKITIEEIKQGVYIVKHYGYRVETIIDPDKNKYYLLVLKYLNEELRKLLVGDIQLV